MSQNVTNVTTVSCLCSFGFPTTVVSASCGAICNVFTLVLLYKSGMIREVSGKIMANEAVADILLNKFTAIILWSNSLDRRVQIFCLPVVMGLSGVKAFSMVGLSVILSVAVCRPLLYKIYVLPRRVTIFVTSLWLFVPVMTGCSYLNDTFYKRNADSGCVEPNYTYRNWWIGVWNVTSVLVLPLIVIFVCAWIIGHKHTNHVLKNNNTHSSGSEKKIRVVKLMVILFILNALSKIPFHAAAALHVESKPVLGAVSVLYFTYSSAKLYLYIHTLENFRRAALRMCCWCRNENKPAKVWERVVVATPSVISNSSNLQVYRDSDLNKTVKNVEENERKR